MKNTIIKKLICTLLVLSTAISLSACGKTSITFTDCVSVTYSGYNGLGEAKIETNDEVINSLVKQEKVDEYIASLSNELLEGSNFSDLIEFKFVENCNNLSNGDEIKIQVEMNEFLALADETLESMSKSLGISLEDTIFTYTVEGLEEANVLDAVSFVSDYIVYSGANGGGTASVVFPDDFTYQIDDFSFVEHTNNTLKILHNHEYIGKLFYKCRYDEKLSEGVNFEVYVEEDSWERLSYNLEQLGYVLNCSKTITTPDLGEYVSSKDEFSNELKRALDAAVHQDLSKEKYTIHTYYWGTIKPSTHSNNLAEDKHKIFVFASYEGDFDTTECISYGTRQMIKRPDGSYYVELVVEDSAYSLNDLRIDGYDVVKIG